MNAEAFKAKYKYHAATPVMQQYLDVKFASIDCLVLFRMGDFYELFYEDAIVASRVLGIALTKRGRTGEEEIAMCGVPHHALENYLNKLLEDGFKIAICDQLETPEEAKKRGGHKAVVRRSVTRIITPGTITEETLLNSGEPSYLASIAIGKNQAAICYADLSTSEIFVISLAEEQIIHELSRLRPKEILLSDKFRASGFAESLSTALERRISFQVDSFFMPAKAEKIILAFYKIQSLSAIGELSSEHISALGSVIEYVSLTQKDNAPKLPKPKILACDKFMNIDLSTRRNLEITRSLIGSTKGSLFDCLDNTVSKAGSRLLYSYLSAPLIDQELINKRLDITEFFYQHIQLSQNIRLNLKKTGDLARCVTRLAMKRSTPPDLLSIKNTIETAELIRAEFVQKIGINLPDPIEMLVQPLIGHGTVYNIINEAIKDNAPNSLAEGGVIKDDFHPKIKELRSLIDNGKEHIDKLKDKYKAETGIESLKISYNNVIGLFIDVTSKNSNKITDGKFIHRQTTVNSVRYTTIELQELESKMINAKTQLISLEQEIYGRICSEIIDNQAILTTLADSLAKLDVFCNLALIAEERGYVRPEMTDDLAFDIKDGRHPVVENYLTKSHDSFISNDCQLSLEHRIYLITGPNMSGKSTFLRQNALIAIMAHIGCYVPARSARIGIINKIFSRIGAGDDLTKGQSTFMVEMLETSAILAQSTYKSLIILDEVGRGTSTYDGVAIAWSVLEYIHDKIKARCLFATHYHELVAMENILPALGNYTVAIDENEGRITFLHKIIKGAADRSYGVHVAEIAGLPKSVIKRATGLLAKMEKEGAKGNKELMRDQSPNLSLFDLKASNNNHLSKYQPLIEALGAAEPDKLSPREALDMLYKLKGLGG